jgi:hypothetical protein
MGNVLEEAPPQAENVRDAGEVPPDPDHVGDALFDTTEEGRITSTKDLLNNMPDGHEAIARIPDRKMESFQEIPLDHIEEIVPVRNLRQYKIILKKGFERAEKVAEKELSEHGKRDATVIVLSLGAAAFMFRHLSHRRKK